MMDALTTIGVDALHGQSMNVARTASTKNKYQKRKGAKAVKEMERLESTSFALNPEEATLYRALSARANYLAQDRPDIAFSTKELCREFAIPNKDSYQKLKRVCRYLIGLPRLVYVYPWQALPDAIDVYTDSDFAGDKISRRGASGGTVMFGTHNIRHWAETQTTLSLSSGEAELHGIGKSIQHALGLRSLFKDMGTNIQLRVHSLPRQRLVSLDAEDSASCAIWTLRIYGFNLKSNPRKFSSLRSWALLIRPTYSLSTSMQRHLQPLSKPWDWSEKKVGRNQLQPPLNRQLIFATSLYWDVNLNGQHSPSIRH
jgi:hypothetical protein